MPISFPSNPTLNSQYTYSGRTWYWNGYAWKSLGTIQGTSGPQGIQGIQGVQGTQGIQGPVAATFANGIVLGLIEAANIVSSATLAATTYHIDVKTSTIYFYTTASTAPSGFVINIRGDSSTTLNSLLPINDAITVIFMNTTGAVTTSYPSSFTIDGVSQTVKWAGALAPSSGNSSGIDIYTYTIVKTASSTYTVFGSQVKFA